MVSGTCINTAEAPAVEEEELQDPMIAVREDCQQKSECKKYRDRLDECTERVNNTPGTSETCTEELFDFLHCVDHCIAHHLFSKLK
ncbi:hypothetical protein ACJMK2_041432 [Sinanodonta woodiana]|uniref:Cytochrome b-c1 complex subunit 6 n=1 Tax=Sinanodonta woodiana TaxID=1069815 RepID=A0ABD3W613_SINWO